VTKANSEKLVSAIGTGEYSVFRQNKEDAEPKLWSQARVQVYFDRGKYHVHVTHEKQLRQVSTTTDGKQTLSTEDWAGDEARIIVDDEAVYVYNVPFSKGIAPIGKRRVTTGEIFSREQEQFGFAMSGFSFNEAVRLWKRFPDLDQVVKDFGADAVAYSEIGEGRFRVTYPYPAKPYLADLDVDRSVAFNITAFRVRNSERKDAAPVTSEQASWKRVNDTWYINELVQERDTRGSGAKSESFSRSVFKYSSFDANVKIEPHLFELKSCEIPIGMRFTDRRQKDTPQVLYWNGTALQAERP
jgi:hypothetical protein